VARARQQGLRTLEEIQRVVTAEELREKSAHGDSDLESRFRTRVPDLVGFAVAESGGSQ
jgi:hypothetical protein